MEIEKTKELIQLFEEACEEVGEIPEYFLFKEDGSVFPDNVAFFVEECDKGYIVGDRFIPKEKIEEIEERFKKKIEEWE